LRRFLVWHVSFQAAAHVVGIATGLALTMMLSRHLGPAGFGGFTYLFAFLYFFLAANDLGINTIAVRELSQQPERAAEILGRLLSLRIVLAAGTLAVAWLVILAMRFPVELAAALGIFMLVLPLTALKAPVVIFQSTLRFEYAVWVDLASRLAGLGLAAVVVWAKGGLVAVSFALVLAEVVGWAVMHHLVRRLVRPVWRVDRRYWTTLVRSSLPLGLAGLLSALINRLDFFMLERMTDLTQVGLYGAAYKITSLAERVPQLVMNTLYPVMARCAREDPGRLDRVYRHSLWWLGAAAVPMAAAVSLGADLIVRLVFGGGYADAAAPLRVLIWASACLYAALPGGVLLISLGRERVNLVAQATAVVVNVALNLAWIPRWGVTGAALATLASFAVILAVTAVASELALSEARAGGGVPSAAGVASASVGGPEGFVATLPPPSGPEAP